MNTLYKIGKRLTRNDPPILLDLPRNIDRIFFKETVPNKESKFWKALPESSYGVVDGNDRVTLIIDHNLFSKSTNPNVVLDLGYL